MRVKSYDDPKRIAREAIEDAKSFMRPRRTFSSTEEREKFFKRRWIRQTANRVGLTHVALLSPCYVAPGQDPSWAIRVDPQALAIAEQVLAPRYGIRGSLVDNGCGVPEPSRGGFDSCGVYGLSTRQVANAWYAAGCKDTGKFRLQIYNLGLAPRLDFGRAQVITAKKGDSLPFLRNYYRGLRWLNFRPRNLSRKAVAALGRVSPNARRAALMGIELREDYDMPKIRVRDLNWSAVRQMTQQLRENPHPKVLAAYGSIHKLDSIYELEDWNTQFKDDKERVYVEVLTPQYPNISVDQSRQLVLGKTPVEISGGVFSKKEAHEWLRRGGREAPMELLSYSISNETGLTLTFRSVKVARWFETLWASNRRETLTRQRVAQGVGGETREFSMVDILDEVQDEDIITGKDRVDDVLVRVHERFGEKFLSKCLEDHGPLASTPHWANKLPKYARLLNTPHALATEGTQMKQCVGGYVNSVRSGQCFILHIHTRLGGSTVELSPNLNVVQHRTVSNGTPALRNQWILNGILGRIK